ncbi:MAG TPA: 16S rRNA (guanine(527)-N(7))-methyltransferase RsmG [Thiobacillaceae bacterium]|nr:16S rRNA (guanine(527)-N(7))-methyltransferase RsmG [Thiobacillaceae bacterium]
MTPAEILAEGAGKLALNLPSATQDKILAFLQLLARWNRVYNLTARRSPQEWMTHHVLDSLSVLPHVRGPLLLDVGSGAGLPGLILAMARPDWRVVSVETVDKKASFQRQAVAELGLANVQVEACRVEELALSDRSDTVISRAFSSLGEFVNLTRDLLKPGGEWAAMKGRVPLEEITALPEDVKVSRVLALKVPGLNAERCIVFIEQN